MDDLPSGIGQPTAGPTNLRKGFLGFGADLFLELVDLPLQDLLEACRTSAGVQISVLKASAPHSTFSLTTDIQPPNFRVCGPLPSAFITISPFAPVTHSSPARFQRVNQAACLCSLPV